MNAPTAACARCSSFEDGAAHLRQGLAGVVLGQVIGRLRQGRLAVAARLADHPVVHAAVVGDQDHQQPALGQADEIHLPQARHVTPRQQHHAGLLAQIRQQPAGRLHQPAGVGAGAQFLAQDAFFGVVDGRGAQQGVDKHPQALGRRDAPGRGVRRGDQAQPLQVGHDVAQRGGAQTQIQIACQGLGADRPAVGDVMLHQPLEQAQGTVVQLVGGSASGRGHGELGFADWIRGLAIL